MVATLEKTLLLVDRRKEIAVPADILGHAEKRVSALT
jgi:hypothetical protein